MAFMYSLEYYGRLAAVALYAIVENLDSVIFSPPESSASNKRTNPMSVTIKTPQEIEKMRVAAV